MKSEAGIRNLLEILKDIYHDERNTFTKYTSMFSQDENGKPLVCKGEQASAVENNIAAAIQTLEWVLEETNFYRRPKNEDELLDAERRGLRITYMRNMEPHIPDTSIDTFIAGIEGFI